MRIISATLSLALILATSGSSFALAQVEIDAKSVRDAVGVEEVVPEEIEPQGEASSTIVAIDNEITELTQEEKFTRAKDGLGKALGLAIQKVDELNSDLESREFPEDSLEYELRGVFIEKLRSYKTFYADGVEGLSSLGSLEEVQQLAKDVKAYRDEVYTPGIETVVEFILVFYSEDVMNIANERFTNILSDLEQLKTLGLIDEEAFGEEITEIERLLSEAAGYQGLAKSLIIIPIADEVEENQVSVIEEAATPEAEDADSPALSIEQAGGEEEELLAPKELLEKGFNDIKMVYASFLEISNVVKESLGIN